MLKKSIKRLVKFNGFKMKLVLTGVTEKTKDE